MVLQGTRAEATSLSNYSTPNIRSSKSPLIVKSVAWKLHPGISEPTELSAKIDKNNLRKITARHSKGADGIGEDGK